MHCVKLQRELPEPKTLDTLNPCKYTSHGRSVFKERCSPTITVVNMIHIFCGAPRLLRNDFKDHPGDFQEVWSKCKSYGVDSRRIPMGLLWLLEEPRTFVHPDSVTTRCYGSKIEHINAGGAASSPILSRNVVCHDNPVLGNNVPRQILPPSFPIVKLRFCHCTLRITSK